jgi:hypothetical protein
LLGECLSTLRTIIWKFKTYLVLALTGLVLFFFQNCGVEQPKVDSGYATFASLSPQGHQSLAPDTKCASCHESARPQALTVSHMFDHKNAAWIGQDCITCHTDRQVWGNNWSGGQFAHDPYPASCIECHQNQMPTAPVFIANDPTRPITHTAGAECMTCHTSTSKFDTLSDWRPAAFQPSGLVGNKTFSINVIATTFTGSIMNRAAPVAKLFKLEIDHGDSVVGNMACATCHTSTASGVFAGALFHRNITANPATCVECHTNARPVGAVGTKGFMRHESVAWVSNTIGAVNRGTTALVGTECATCHLNASSMPQAGANPVAGSKPFSGASFHLNTNPATLSSCLDCHAHSRPTGSANFTDATWKNKTNVGGPPFTTFDLARHAPNVDCATCHTAPGIANTTANNWAVGYFAHSSANINCLNCHTNSGVTSTNHTGFNSNCSTCHTGATARFPNPVIGDWKVAVTGGVPNGVVGEKSIPNAFNCTGVQASLPNCTPSTPNIIVKGMDHSVNTNAVTCVNCHGAGAATAANGKFHTSPGIANWIAPAAADIANCTKCHDPAISPTTVTSIKNVGTVGSQASVSTGTTPFSGVNHGAALIAGQQCVLCHTAPTPAVSRTWNVATKIHTQFTQAQITTCVLCHYKRMPAGALVRKNQLVYKGTHNPQKFTHTSSLSMPTIAGQSCATCHADGGVSWTSRGANWTRDVFDY